ncbi:MAG: hypothetical protein QM695_12375 [Micropruina sp.]
MSVQTNPDTVITSPTSGGRKGGPLIPQHVAAVLSQGTFSIVPEGDIPAHHPDVASMWRKMAELADANGFCAEYERLCDTLGAPSRPHDYLVGEPGEERLVRATSAGEAQRIADLKIDLT